LNESCKNKELATTQQSDNSQSTNKSSLASRISNPSNRNHTPRAKRHCGQCQRDGHYTSQCRFLGKNKCRECGWFGHDSDKCPGDTGTKRLNNRSSNNSGSNKKAKCKAHNTDDSGDAGSSNAQQSNSAIVGCYVVVNGSYEEANVGEIDDDGEYYNMNKSYDDPCQIDERVAYYKWLADMGTTSHITHQRDAFFSYTPIPQIPISGVGSLKAHAIRKGTVYLQSECSGYLHTLQLNNILHIPMNRNNLLSLGSWEEVGRRFYGRFGKLSLITNDRTVIAVGTKITNRLYKMKFTLVPPISSKFTFVTRTSAPTWETWH